jgi:hypothetical protein
LLLTQLPGWQRFSLCCCCRGGFCSFFFLQENLYHD